MHRLRHGDHGPAVAEIRGTLAKSRFPAQRCRRHPTRERRRFALDCSRRRVRSSPRQRRSGLPAAAWASRRRHRGPCHLPVHSKEASYRLGARTLIYQLSAPLYGDDVATLQTRLQDLGFYVGARRRLLRPADPRLAVLVPAGDRHRRRRHLRSGHPAVARTARHPRHRWFTARDQRRRNGSQLRTRS